MRGFDDGGRGGNGPFNFAAGEGLESEIMELGSDGGAFSLEALGFQGGLGLAEIGFGDEGGSVISLNIAFLGCMKCFIEKCREKERGFQRERERE